MTDNLMTLSIKSKDREASISCNNGLDIWDMAIELKQLLIAWGYSPEVVDRIFINDEVDDTQIKHAEQLARHNSNI